MAQIAPSHPKALLFDIGGVCVISPMSAILAYEQAHRVPVGWINFAISRSAPDGAWHRLERGQILVNTQFFTAFERDLQHAGHWSDYHRLLAAQQQNRPSRGRFRTQADQSDVRVSNDVPPMEELPIPPPAPVNAEDLFWLMMRVSREPDPFMQPALQQLKASKKFVMGALSNTVIFPPGHPFGLPPDNPAKDVRAMFDVFVSSAHVGRRKPEKSIYDLAAKWLEDQWRSQGGEGIFRRSDIVFLDDIGENLKIGRRVGFRTIKVGLNGTEEAVRHLESITGMQLLGSREATQPKL